MILAFKHTHLIPYYDVLLCILARVYRIILSYIIFLQPPCPSSLNTVLYPSHWQPLLTVLVPQTLLL